MDMTVDRWINMVKQHGNDTKFPSAAIAIAFANAAGTFSGGVLAAVRELGPRGLVRLIVIGLFLGSCCFIGTMFLGCPQSSLAGALHDG